MNIKNRKRCRVCRNEQVIDYKDIESLKNFINENGHIVPRSRNGNCAKHQRSITTAIKRARNLALLPFSR